MLTQPDEFDVVNTEESPEDYMARQVAQTALDVEEILTILRPLREIIAALPEALQKVEPLIEGLKNSPVLKMLGIKL